MMKHIVTLRVVTSTFNGRTLLMGMCKRAAISWSSCTMHMQLLNVHVVICVHIIRYRQRRSCRIGELQWRTPSTVGYNTVLMLWSAWGLYPCTRVCVESMIRKNRETRGEFPKCALGQYAVGVPSRWGTTNGSSIARGVTASISRRPTWASG